MQNGLARVLCFDETDFDGAYDDYQEFRPDLVVEHVMTADEGFKRLRTRNYEFVIADMLMSPVSGLEIAEIIKRNPKIFGTPAIALFSVFDVQDFEKYITEELKVHFINLVGKTFWEIYAEFDSFISAYVFELELQKMVWVGE